MDDKSKPSSSAMIFSANCDFSDVMYTGVFSLLTTLLSMMTCLIQEAGASYMGSNNKFS